MRRDLRWDIRRTSGCGELEGTEADIVEGFVVEAHGHIRILDELMYGESGVVGLHNCIRHLWRGHDAERDHHAVRVLLPDLGDEQGTHAGARSAAHGVADLET